MNSNTKLPSKRQVEDAIKIIEDFRSMCRHQLDLGYWGTVDFPSKHHINRLLQLQYVDSGQVHNIYGAGLSRQIYQMIAVCKSYVAFLREDNEKLENTKQVNSFKK